MIRILYENAQISLYWYARFFNTTISVQCKITFNLKQILTQAIAIIPHLSLNFSRKMDLEKLDSCFDFESTLDNLENEPTNPFTKSLEFANKTCNNLFKTNVIVKTGLKLFLFLSFNAYLIFAIIYYVNSSSPIGWCDGVGFLIICTTLAYIGVLYSKIIKPRQLLDWIFQPLKSVFIRPRVQVGCGIGAVVGFIGFLLYDTQGDAKRLQPCFGMILLIGLGVVGSKHPGRIRWRHVVWGMGLQLTFGLLILRTDTGKLVLTCISDKVTECFNHRKINSLMVNNLVSFRSPLFWDLFRMDHPLSTGIWPQG